MSTSLDSAPLPAEPLTPAKAKVKPSEVPPVEPLSSPSLPTAVESEPKSPLDVVPSTTVEAADTIVTAAATVASSSPPPPLGPLSASSPAPHCTSAALASLPASPSSLWESASPTAAVAPTSTAAASAVADQEAAPCSSRASDASVASSASTEPMRDRSAASLSPTPPQHLSIHEEVTLSFVCEEDEGEGGPNAERGGVADVGFEGAPQLLSPVSMEETAGVSDTSSFDEPGSSGKTGGARPAVGSSSTTAAAAPTLAKSPRLPGRRRRIRSSSSSVAAGVLDEEKAGGAVNTSHASSRRAGASARRQAVRQATRQQASAASSSSSRRDSPAFGSPLLTSNAPLSAEGHLSSPSTPACYSAASTSAMAAAAAAATVTVSCTSALSGLATTATATPSTASTTTAGAGATAMPMVRRFGGPFFPIADFDSMPSDIRCQKLQQSLCQILDSWRSARQYLKDLDQRVTRSQRMRNKRHAEVCPPERTVARSPSPLMPPTAAPSVSSPPLLSQ